MSEIQEATETANSEGAAGAELRGENNAVIDLSAPRVIALQGPQRAYKLTCRPVTPADWLAYYECVEVSSTRDGKDLLDVFNTEMAQRVLAERMLIDVQGYEVEGGVDLMTLPNWQARVPLAHRLKVGSVLATAFMDREGSDVICMAGELVVLDALWTADEKNSMSLIKGLRHVLKTPSEEQYRSYSRESNRTRILGGSRAGTTVYPGVQPLLAKLYDELVVSVEGYVADEAPLADAAAIVKSMDMHHKVVVAQQIFAPRTQEVLA